MLRPRWILLLTLGFTLPGIVGLTFASLGWINTPSAASAPASPGNSDDDPEGGQPPLLSSTLSPMRHHLVPPRRVVRTAARPQRPVPASSPAQLRVQETRQLPLESRPSV